MKKTLMIMLALVLVIAMSVTGTMAYLTSKTEVVENTFTVGNVEITLDELNVNKYGEVDGTVSGRGNGNQYKLIPGHTYKKDPTVHVTVTSEQCYLFVKVVNGITAIEDQAKTIAAQMAAKGWVETDQENVYRYNTIVDARTEAKDVVVFDTFTVAQNADVSAVDTDTAKITIAACAVQADGLSADDALDQATFNF